jgi:VWFA-related protein
MRMPCGIAAVLVLALVGLPAAGRAQLEPSPDASPVSNAPPAPDDQSVATLKLNVNLVDLFFTVKDKHGNLVPHLTQKDCTVFEDRVPQKLKNFVAETDQPLTLGVLLDTSGSQERVLPLEQQAGAQFLERVLRKKDEAFLVSFDVNVDLLQDFTDSARQLSHAMDKAQINAAGVSGVPGLGGGPVPISNPKGTLLYDAIYLAANEKLSEQTGRKALIILTDGEDEGSKTKIQEAIAAAQRDNVMIYIILMADREGYWSQGMGYFGYSAAKKIADGTGGRLIDVGNNSTKLQAAFEQIEDELRTQYVASYTPSNAKLDGTFRHISVQCGDGMKVQVRQGYFAPKGE